MSKNLVDVDTLAAVASGVVGLAALSGHDNALGGGMILTGALYAGSALRGNGVVERCRAAWRDYSVAMVNAANERAPAIAAKPQDPYTSPAAAAAPPPIPRPVPPAPKAEPEPAPAPRPAELKLDASDAFHVLAKGYPDGTGLPGPVGAPEPGRPAPKPNPAKPAASDAWRDFWRGIP
jgi:hypothetical protein